MMAYQAGPKCMRWLGWAVVLMLLAIQPAIAATATATIVPENSNGSWQQADAYFRAGNMVEARAAWDRAADEYAAGGDARGQALALVRSGETSVALGEQVRAVETLQQALTLSQEIADPALESAAAGALGNAYAQAGLYDEASSLLNASAETAKAIDAPALAASAYNNLGNVMAYQGRPTEAESAYRQAIDAASRAQDNALALRASANLARVQLENNNPEAAAKTLDQATPRLQALPDSHEKIYTTISIGRLYQRLAADGGDQQAVWARQAQTLLNQAATDAERVGDLRAQSFALGYQGELYERAGRYDEALGLTQRAIFAAQRANLDDPLYRWQWQSGRILKASGQQDLAVLSFEQSVYTLESIRQDVNTGLRARQTSFRDSVGPIYFGLADLLLLRSAASTDADAGNADLLRARDTVELLKSAELEDYFQDDCVASLQAKTSGIDRLDPGTAALYPIVLPDRTEVLVSLPDGLTRYTVPVDSGTLTNEIRSFRAKLEKRTTHEYYPHARQLYDWLVAPIDSELGQREISTLVIVPDGPLRTIPLAALHDGKRFLGARYAMATTPGLTLTDPQPIERGELQILANGLSDPVQGFPGLPSVEQELDDIQQTFDATVLRNQEFTSPNMERELNQTPFSIVHIASHGQFEGDVDNTFLLTYDDKMSMNALEQFIGTTKFRDDAVELLTLSACQTAAGDDRAALGLAGVAVKAGARSALATLWTVNDPASAALVSEFYNQLQDPTVSKAEALHRAQLLLSEDLRYWHPGYWSPFLLIGNWL